MLVGRRPVLAAIVAVLVILTACEEEGTGTGQEGPGGDTDGNGSSGLPTVVLTADEQAGYDALMSDLLGADGLSGRLANYWFEEYPNMVLGSLYRPPTKVTRYEGAPQPSACGPLGTDNAWYCSNDEALYYDDNFLRTLYRAYGVAAPTILLAHEWGHHIQTVMVAPETSIAAELQADCLAGMFFGTAFEPPPGEQDLRSAGATLFLLGDQNYRASEWFAPDVHGPPSWRAKAFLDGMLGDGAYCTDYSDWVERGTTSIGNYEWLPAPGVEIGTGEGTINATLRGRTAFIATATEPVSGTALEALPSMFAEWFEGTATAIGAPVDIETGEGVGGIIGGTGAAQAFQFTDTTGGIGHGIFFVHVATTGDSAIVTVYTSGAPPANDMSDPAWDPMLNWMFVVAFSLCPPDGAGTMCVALGGE